MTLPKAQPGLVIRYAYLWRDRRDAGHEHGDKDRPCAVVLMRATAGDAVAVTVAPITRRAPDIADNAVQLPRSVKQAIGLDDAPAWVITTEVNRFLWPGPDLRRSPVPDHRVSAMASFLRVCSIGSSGRSWRTPSASDCAM